MRGHVKYITKIGNKLTNCVGSWDSVVGIVARLWAGSLKSRGLIPGRDKRFMSPPDYQDGLWGPSNLLFIVYGDIFLCGKAAGS